MNIQELANHLEIEESQCLELTELFLKTSSTELTHLESAIGKKDLVTIERMAHSIKGSAVILGLSEIHEAAKKIEIAARENRLMEINRGVLMIREKLGWMAEVLQGKK
ncbi:MAG: Hpt domain-containing protein [Deltaproteobacteria bacterium]|nr:Hpt domain-containing protein [Deltaproteobacteria bacterium]